jgi:hypothetical protein
MSTPAPPPQTLATALGRSEPLTSLMQRLRESQARFDAIATLLPVGLKGEVRAGPLDDAAWVLLVSHAAAAAKIRQLLPTLEATLKQHGWPGPAIKIKVLPRP